MENGIHVILPMVDPTHLDSIYRFLEGDLIWKIEPNGLYGNNYMKRLSYAGDGVLRFDHLYPENDVFLSRLEEHHPQDLEFFIWHPEVFKGEYHE
jgi:hypothetical protein